MTDLLQEAVASARELAVDDQERAARVLLSFINALGEDAAMRD